MVETSRPGMGTADRTGFRKASPGFKGCQIEAEEKIFFLTPLGKRICRVGENLRQTPPWRTCEKVPDRKDIDREQIMLRFIDHHPSASLWLIAIAQGLAMLGLNVALRALVL
jgi:hypothetical protein